MEGELWGELLEAVLLEDLGEEDLGGCGGDLGVGDGWGWRWGDRGGGTTWDAHLRAHDHRRVFLVDGGVHVAGGGGYWGHTSECRGCRQVHDNWLDLHCGKIQ